MSRLLYKNSPVTQIQVKSLGNNFQSHCSCNYIHLHAIAFWISFDNSSKVLRNPLPTWSLPDARTSVLAGCFHFTLPHGCCLFFFAKVCLVVNGPRYILSALWQCNFKEISWQISSNGASMVIANSMYHLQIADSLVHCFSFTSLPSVSGYSVNIQQDRSIHTQQCHIASHYNV